MDVLSAMRIFRTVADKGGFSTAAKTLNISKASVSKQVSALEERLGARLLNRTTRRLSLTEIGQGYLDRARQILDDVEETESAVSLHHAAPCGTIRVNAPMSFGLQHLSPALCDFMSRYPDLSVDLSLNDRRIDLIEEGVDVALRIGRLADSSLIARRIAPARFAVCASPAYWDTHGRPQTPSDLASHLVGVYTMTDKPAVVTFIAPDGTEETVKVSGRLKANNGKVLHDAALADQAVVMSPTFMVGSDLRAGRLEQVLSAYGFPDAGIYAVYPPGRHLSAKVRAFVDFLVERFGPEPSWDHPAG